MSNESIIPRSADEVIASLGNISENNRIVIRLISEKQWTAYELSLLVVECPDFDTNGASGDKLADNLYGRLLDLKLRYGVSAVNACKKEWFACGTLADPEIKRVVLPQDALVGPVVKKGQKRRLKERSLRSIMFEILSKLGPLEQRRLVFEIKRHPDYHDMYADHIALRKAINGTLRNNSLRHQNLLFEKCDDGSRLSRWGIKSGAEAPVIRIRLQVKALVAIMSHKWRTRGWFIKELVTAAMAEGSSYRLMPSATETSVTGDIISHLSRHRGKVFEQVCKEVRLTRWRVKPPTKLKVPATPRDWDALVRAIAHDEGVVPTFSWLVESIRHNAWVFGWDTLLLPSALVTNQVALSVGRVFPKGYLAPEVEVPPEPKERPAPKPAMAVVPKKRLMGDEGLSELLAELELPEV